MRTGTLGTAVAAATLIAFGGQVAATASVSPPIKVASVFESENPSMLVDSQGTLLTAYSVVAGKPDQYGERFPYVRVARKTRSAKKFTVARLPSETTNEDPYLFQASRNAIDLIVTLNGPGTLAAWQSTNDGKTWKTIDAAALNDPSLHTNGIYVSSAELGDAPGGPVEYAGTNGGLGAIVQINNALTKVTQIATGQQSMYKTQVVETSGGAIVEAGVGTATTSYPYQVDSGGQSHLGSVAFPTCTKPLPAPQPQSDFSMAAGSTVAVVTSSTCGHVWARSISSKGVVGKLVSLGPGSSHAWTDVVADAHHHFTALFAEPGDDLGIAHSSNGTRWSTSKGSMPVHPPFGFGTVGSLSRGSTTWFGYSVDGSQPNTELLRAMPLSDTYRAPKLPSSKGVPHATHSRLGSLAVTAPHAISAARFRPHGLSTVKVVDALPEKLAISVAVDRVRKTSDTVECTGGASPRVRANHVVTLHLKCAQSGGIVLDRSRGAGSSRVPVKKGDVVTYGFEGRNGTITITSKIT